MTNKKGIECRYLYVWNICKPPYPAERSEAQSSQTYVSYHSNPIAHWPTGHPSPSVSQDLQGDLPASGHLWCWGLDGAHLAVGVFKPPDLKKNSLSLISDLNV